MNWIRTRNTNTAAPKVYDTLMAHGKMMESRNGKVLVYPEPLCVHYTHPQEKVNFNEDRDANPFFHYMEALWMLAGRNDLEFLTRFLNRMKDFSDDGETLNAAYGYRLRNHFGMDQLAVIADTLAKDPTSRQCVAQMWDPNDLAKSTKDKACNTQLMFAVRNDAVDMTVINRSNDAVLGGVTGANIVHLPMLQEYVAHRAGYLVGSAYVFSNNLHIYMDEPKWDLLSDAEEDDWPCPYVAGTAEAGLLITDPPYFDIELKRFFLEPRLVSRSYKNSALSDVAVPMYLAYDAYRQKRFGDAMRFSSWITHSDWRIACQLWVTRRANVHARRKSA